MVRDRFFGLTPFPAAVEEPGYIEYSWDALSDTQHSVLHRAQPRGDLRGLDVKARTLQALARRGIVSPRDPRSFTVKGQAILDWLGSADGREYTEHGEYRDGMEE